MEYLRKAHKPIYYILLVTLIISLISLVLLSIYIFVVPELHQQILDIEVDMYGNAFYGFGYSSENLLFSQIFQLQRISKQILLIVSILTSIYLVTGSRLTNGAKVLGKNKYIEILLVVTIFPLLAYGLTSLVCNIFIGMIYPAHVLVSYLFIISGLLLMIIYILITQHTNYKYTKAIHFKMIGCYLIIVPVGGLYLIYGLLIPYYILVTAGLLFVICLTYYIKKMTATKVGI